MSVSVKWMALSGVSATIVAVRSVWPTIAASPTMSPDSSCAISLPSRRTETVPSSRM